MICAMADSGCTPSSRTARPRIIAAFLQARAGRHSKGRMTAASNVLTFSGVALGAVLFGFLSGPFGLGAAQIVLVMTLIASAGTIYLMVFSAGFSGWRSAFAQPGNQNKNGKLVGK